MRPVKFISAICLIVITTFVGSSCSKSDTNGSGLPAAQNVSILAMAFSPATVTVVEGTVVTWTNTDSGPHTVTSDNGTSFNSGSISPGGTYSFTATTIGS